MFFSLIKTFVQWSFDFKRVIVLYNDLKNYFTICFKHRCNTVNTQVLLWRTFLFTLFATLFRKHKNYGDTIVHWVCCDEISSILSKVINISGKSIAFRPVSNSFLPTCFVGIFKLNMNNQELYLISLCNYRSLTGHLFQNSLNQLINNPKYNDW